MRHAGCAAFLAGLSLASACFRAEAPRHATAEAAPATFVARRVTAQHPSEKSVHKLPRQAHSLELDSRGSCGLGKNVSDGTRPRLSWGRSSLYSGSQDSVISRTCSSESNA